MSQYVISVIRTWVPVLMGSLAGWLLVTFGIEVPKEAQEELTLLIGGAAIALYYALVRWLEQKFPNVGILLGYIKQPVYVDPKQTPTEQITKVDAAIVEVAKTPVSGN